MNCVNDEVYCMCRNCEENTGNACTCSHCITCIDGEKAVDTCDSYISVTD